MRVSSRSQTAITLPLLFLSALLVLPVSADVTLGGDARAVAMGGAGLASGYTPELSTLNPAALADTGPRFSIQWPSVNASADGASYSDAFKLIGNPSLKAGDALDYARTLGDQNTRIQASANAGLLLPRADVQLRASIRTDIRPNDSFKQWAKAGGDDALPTDARADVYAGGVSTLPSIGIGFHLPTGNSGSTVSVGVRVNPQTAYYSHYVIDSDSILNGTPSHAAEMAGKDYIKQGSYSADLGITYTPANLPNAHLAMVVNNIIEPKAIAFTTPSADGETRKQLSPRSISAGAAVENNNVTLAADLVDINGAYGSMQFRVGAEVRGPGGIALRGGYNTDTGFTVGAGLGGFGIAYSKDAPIMLSQVISF